MPREWTFISEGGRAGGRAASQLSSNYSEERLESALKHIRQQSNEVRTRESEEEGSSRDEQGVPLRAVTLQPVQTSSVPLTERSPSQPSLSATLVKSDFRQEVTHRAFEIQTHKPSEIFQRLPPISQTPSFPNTLEVLKLKEAKRQVFKKTIPEVSGEKHHRRTYQSAWYLPPSHWKAAPQNEGTSNKYSLHRGISYSARAPYFYLHSNSKPSLQQKGVPQQGEFEENVKKFQRMPMMSKFKGHLEAHSLRVPPFLQTVKSDHELEPSYDSGSSSDSEQDT